MMAELRSLRAVARSLGGEVAGAQVLCPGPGHGPRDRSLSVRLSPAAPDGFIVFSHAGDDFQTCRDHVRALLGLPRENAPPRPTEAPRRPPKPEPDDESREEKIRAAIAVWRSGADPRGTLVETYLRSRGLDLDDYVADEVLDWHPGIHAMVALFRDVHTNRPQAVCRTFLDAEGRKLERKFLGPVGGAAIMLDPFDDVLGGLHIGEGLETCMAARQLGLRPTWALGSAGAVAAFPVLGGIEALNVIVDHDANGAGERAARDVEKCWRAAGREVNLLRSDAPGDLNDALRGIAR